MIQSKLIHFEEFARVLYHHQAAHNPILQNYLEHTGAVVPVQSFSEVRFLPVSFFKNKQVITGGVEPECVFSSSTTGGGLPSLHYVGSRWIYEKSYQAAFRLFYGNPEEYVFLCLLPSYLERKGSSLIEMADGLIRASGDPDSGFYLDELDELNQKITAVQQRGKKVFLLGVTFALLDFSERFSGSLCNDVVMETGGMKGRRAEQTRDEIHRFLAQRFDVRHVHSEYGMTELLSQAYSKGKGRFVCPPWMRIMISDVNDPFAFLPPGKTGIINVADLANVDSCAFIQTSDLGRLHDDGSFEVLGRMDHSEVRGCNLMYA